LRILILANNDVGLYKFRRELIEELVKTHEVYMCLPNGTFISELVKIGAHFIPCTVLERHGTNPFKELKLILFYRNILKRYNPNIVLTYTIKPNIYGGIICTRMKIPYIVNVTGLGTAVENNGFLQFITLRLYKMGLTGAQKVFFQNEENKAFMEQHGIVTGPYEVIPGSGVNLERFPLLPYPDDEVIRFAFISRIMKEKGIDQYLEAAEIIKAQYSNTEFHVCGFCEKEYEGKLSELNENGTVIYHGMVNDVSGFLKDIHCVIHPTYYPEGMSNVLLEACASGRPIITTNRSGCREVVEDGVNGYIVEEKNSQDLIAKIELFLDESVNEHMEMGIAGRKKVEKEFDRHIVVKKYLLEANQIMNK
jgi:glycosyltransferase involved in cell wall biosynthesis